MLPSNTMARGAVPSNESLDSPEASIAHARHIRSKRMLREIYLEHYRFFRDQLLDAPPGGRIEIGSGGGFIRDVLPEAITSDVVALPAVKLVMSGTCIPVPDGKLSGIVMINVLHHLQDAAAFFREAGRCLAAGGKIVMVEPANTLFSRFVYRNFHHEPFDPDQSAWELPPGGRMSSANDALPWIVFCRDRERFEREFPNLEVTLVRNFMPFRYIVSGGVSKPQLLPGWASPALTLIERVLSPFNDHIGLFMQIVVRKR
jgi:SAM-dependent methyltransferase